MKEKIVYQLDSEGYFVESVIADESPLEPGVFMIPAHCIEVEPPPAINYTARRWAGKWIYEDMYTDTESEPVVITTPEPTFDLDQAKKEATQTILNSIIRLEQSQARPIREITLALAFGKQDGEANAKLLNLNAEITRLRELISLVGLADSKDDLDGLLKG